MKNKSTNRRKPDSPKETIFSKVFGVKWSEDKVGLSFIQPVISKKRYKDEKPKLSWTNKTTKEIVSSKPEDLNFEESIVVRTLQENPDMTLEEADELPRMLQ